MYTEYYPTKASKEEVLRRKMRHWGGQVKGPKRTSCSHVWGTKKSMTHRLYWQCSSIAYEFMDALKLPRLFQFLGSMVWEMPYIQRQFCVITSPTSFPLRGHIFFPERYVIQKCGKFIFWIISCYIILLLNTLVSFKKKN